MALGLHEMNFNVAHGFHANMDLVNSHKIVLVAQRILQSFHVCQDFFLLQSPTDYLHANGEPMHGSRVVQFVCTLCNTIPVLNLEAGWQIIQLFIDAGNRYDASGVIKLRSHIVSNRSIAANSVS